MAAKADLFIVFYYLRLLLRHRLLIIISFCIAIAIGMYLAITMPRIYEAGTLILVVPQRVPSDYVRSVVTTDIQARISTISEQILSRSNLEKIIGKFGLFSAPKYRNMFLDDKLENLRRRIEINVRGSRSRSRSRKESTFSVTFRGSDPLTVMNVTTPWQVPLSRKTSDCGKSRLQEPVPFSTMNCRLCEVAWKRSKKNLENIGGNTWGSCRSSSTPI